MIFIAFLAVFAMCWVSGFVAGFVVALQPRRNEHEYRPFGRGGTCS